MDIAAPVKRLSRKQLVAIPLVLAAFFGSVIAFSWNSTGEAVPLSMEFAGGSFVRIKNIRTPSTSEATDFQSLFKNEFSGSVEVHIVDNGLEVETSNDLLETGENQSVKERIENMLSESGIEGSPDITTEKMGSIITQLYEKQARNAAIAAIIAMAIILFIALRNFSVVGGILSVIGLDLVGIFGVMTILNIPLGLASMAGILLIFGYAVNTNILLTTNVFKRKGKDPRERAGRAMSTGVKMSLTSASAMVALNLVTTAPELEQISAILIIGILVDMVNTWFFNSGLVLGHKIGKEEKYHARI